MKKKNRKRRRAEMKNLLQPQAKRVLTEAERKDHEYGLREKWTEQDTRELACDWSDSERNKPEGLSPKRKVFHKQSLSHLSLHSS